MEERIKYDIVSTFKCSGVNQYKLSDDMRGIPFYVLSLINKITDTDITFPEFKINSNIKKGIVNIEVETNCEIEIKITLIEMKDIDIANNKSLEKYLELLSEQQWSC